LHLGHILNLLKSQISSYLSQYIFAFIRKNICNGMSVREILTIDNS